jgi:phosphoribosylformimino-5-aminoimidazole carboxamide ribotide isomerase
VELYPAVDIQGGRVARAGVAGDDPLAALTAFAQAGARWIHLVDLDRAYGRPDNGPVVQRLLGAATTRVQVGGGLAAESDIDRMAAWGAARVIIGPRGAMDRGLVERLLARHSAERLAVGIDAKGGRVAPRGTNTVLELTARDLAAQVYRQGIRTVIYNDVARDGMLTGPDVAGARALAAVGKELNVIVSGGVASLDDVRAVKAAGLAGAVVGRALYEGRFTLAEALACVA